MTLQTVFGILVVLYTVSNMASIGLELNPRETLKSLRSARLVVLTLLWGWVVGPAFAFGLTRVLPLAEPHALGLLIFSLAPVAPMVSILARRARSDMDFTAALIPLAIVAFPLANIFASRAGQAVEGGATGLSMQCAK